MNLWDIFAGGEFVIAALVILLITALILWIVRYIALKSAHQKDISLMHRVRDYVIEGDIENAIALCTAVATPGSRVVSNGLSRIGAKMSEVTNAMDTSIQLETPVIYKGLRWLQAIAVISPLAGLGGTLAGISHRMNIFVETSVSVDVPALAMAITPSLITTIAGLIVGIISVFAYFCLEGYMDKSKRWLEELSVELTALLNEPS